jgi:Spy/CpxP family protein refolding chaperone
MFDTHRPTWNNPRVLGILALVFLCGAVCGALVMRAGLHERLHHSSSFWKNEPLLSYDKLTRELNLSPDQRKALRTILDDYARYHQDLQAQLDDWRATGKSQIMRILGPEQRVRFEELSRQAESN